MELLTNPWVLLLIVLVSGAGVIVMLGAYYLGKKGGDRVHKHSDRMSEETLERLKLRFERWGAWLLLLAVIPYLGFPLSVAAGVVEIRVVSFVVMMFIARSTQTAIAVVLLEEALSAMGLG
jgi:membrane protein YqaA with SNARE-associated domain